MTAEDVIEHLRLQPLPIEGGYFRETYRCSEQIGLDTVSRSLCTAIYYLLTPATISALHRLPFDEVYHFYLGDPVRMLQLWPDGTSRKLILGTDLRAGHTPQFVVPGGVWQGSMLVEGGKFALLGTTMASGFDFADYVEGKREVAGWPESGHLIRRLTTNYDKSPRT
jgi:uncharacterized protein